MYRLKSIYSLTEFPMLTFWLLVSEKISSVLSRMNEKIDQGMVKKIFGRIRWKRIVVEGVKLRVERWMGEKKITKTGEYKRYR